MPPGTHPTAKLRQEGEERLPSDGFCNRHSDLGVNANGAFYKPQPSGGTHTPMPLNEAWCIPATSVEERCPVH